MDRADQAFIDGNELLAFFQTIWAEEDAEPAISGKYFLRRLD